MPKYKKGLLTDIHIIESAKKLFYENGFHKTSIRDICSLANIKIGTFTYYYKKKEDLIKSIYADYLMNHYVLVDSAARDSYLNSLQKNAYAILPYYIGLFDDPKTIKFHQEVLSMGSLYDYMHLNLKRIYHSFIRDLHLDITERELSYISSADLGVRRELTLEYINGEFDGDCTELFKQIYTMMGRLFKIPERLMQQYIVEAIDFYANHDFSGIRLLI
ncbi:hypothetical protein CMETHOX_22830 [Lacrimispora indolis]|nr:hypothetical protein CMETHOX_22830 [[Clostridium] methoxybenzovorans]